MGMSDDNDQKKKETPYWEMSADKDQKRKNSTYKEISPNNDQDRIVYTQQFPAPKFFIIAYP